MKIWEYCWLKKWVYYTIWMNSIRCIFDKKSAIRHFIINRAFFFVTWISFTCLEIFHHIHEYFDMKNLKTYGGIHETWKSKNRNLRYSARRSTEAATAKSNPEFQFIFLSGFMKPPKCPLRRGKKRFMKPPKVQEPKPQVSIYLIFEFHETTKGFKFSCQNSRETMKSFQTSQWNQVTKKKCAVSI